MSLFRVTTWIISVVVVSIIVTRLIVLNLGGSHDPDCIDELSQLAHIAERPSLLHDLSASLSRFQKCFIQDDKERAVVETLSRLMERAIQHVERDQASRVAQMEQLKKYLLQAQQEYRKCLASKSSVVQDSPQDWVLSSSSSRRVRRAHALSTLPHELFRLVPSQDEPLDVVFLWVNGSDPAWRFARNAMLPLSEVYSDHVNSVRSDHETLLYSLRSLLRYGSALRIRTIHIVTSHRQRPSWMCPSTLDWNPNVVFLDDSDILPASASTFNNAAIWSRLDAIPNLAPHFLLWQDDMLLTRHIDRSFFWTQSNGKWGPRVFFRQPSTTSLHVPHILSSDDDASKVEDHLLDASIGVSSSPSSHRHRRSPLAHFPLPIWTPLWRHMLQNVVGQSLVEQTSRSLFSSSSDVRIPLVYAHWLLEHELLGETGSGEQDVASVDVREEALVKRSALGDVVRTKTLVCLVDSGQSVSHMKSILEEFWPFKLPCEK